MMSGGVAREFRDGWWDGARRCPSPNAEPRPAGQTIDLLVLHAISLPRGEYGNGHIDALFTNTLESATHPDFASLRDLRVSAHFLVDREGSITQYVSLRMSAWHAGISAFAGIPGCNARSIGVELEGVDDAAFAQPQLAALNRLIAVLPGFAPGLRISRVVGHSDVAPGRKTDPGSGFDWVALRAELLSRGWRA